MDIENKICDEHGPRVDSYDTAQMQAYDRMNEVSSSAAGRQQQPAIYSCRSIISYSYTLVLCQIVGSHSMFNKIIVESLIV